MSVATISVVQSIHIGCHSDSFLSQEACMSVATISVVQGKLSIYEVSNNKNRLLIPFFSFSFKTFQGANKSKEATAKL
jgi:hypothetical protein